MLVFWVACGLTVGTSILEEHAVSIFSPEGGDSMFLWNIGICLQVHTGVIPHQINTEKKLFQPDPLRIEWFFVRL
jgi:hypothetical protein